MVGVAIGSLVAVAMGPVGSGVGVLVGSKMFRVGVCCRTVGVLVAVGSPGGTSALVVAIGGLGSSVGAGVTAAVASVAVASVVTALADGGCSWGTVTAVMLAGCCSTSGGPC